MAESHITGGGPVNIGGPAIAGDKEGGAERQAGVEGPLLIGLAFEGSLRFRGNRCGEILRLWDVGGRRRDGLRQRRRGSRRGAGDRHLPHSRDLVLQLDALLGGNKALVHEKACRRPLGVGGFEFREHGLVLTPADQTTFLSKPEEGLVFRVYRHGLVIRGISENGAVEGGRKQGLPGGGVASDPVPRRTEGDSTRRGGKVKEEDERAGGRV